MRQSSPDAAADAPLSPVAFRRAKWPTAGVSLMLCVIGAGLIWLSPEMLDPDWHNETSRLLGRIFEDLPPVFRFGLALLMSGLMLAMGGSLVWDASSRRPIILLDVSGVTWRPFIGLGRKTSWDKVEWVEGRKLSLRLDKKPVSMGYAFIDAPRAEVRVEFARFLQTPAGRGIPDAGRRNAR